MPKRKIPKFWNTPLCSPNFKAMQDNKGPATIVQIIGFLFIIFLFVYYWIADYAQLSTRKTLLNYWNLMPLHDGTTNEAVEKYVTRNYVLKIKNDFVDLKSERTIV